MKNLKVDFACIYCADRHGSSPLTQEHIWPQALGGGVCGDLFKSQDVCKKCNEACGLWVDGQFIRSFFGSALRHQSALHFLDPNNPSAIPLICFFQDASAPTSENEICERWIGPSGESVAFFHGRDDPKWQTFSSGNILNRKKNDGGRVYLSLVNRGSYRALLAMESTIKQFPRARYHLTTEVSNLPEKLGKHFVKPLDRTEKEQLEATWFWQSIQGAPISTQPKIDMNFYSRFVAKLALGFGCKILGKEFSKSDYAEGLRAILWPNLGFKFENQVCGNSFWEEVDENLRKIYWQGAWVVAFSYSKEGLGLQVFLPDGKLQCILISNDLTLINDVMKMKKREDIVYVIIPQRSTCFGPFSLNSYISHRLGHESISELSQIEIWEAEAKSIPDMDLPLDA
jgi:hypothetical protein